VSGGDGNGLSLSVTRYTPWRRTESIKGDKE
jgi:hypothetical protein